MRRPRLLVVTGVCLLAPAAGCTINDPNCNDKVRFSMAIIHADRVLSEEGSDLSVGDYELLIFWRRHYDERTRTIHDCQLYDFLKRSPKPGPNHFVIAYDRATRKTYLRADVRSNENLESLRSRTSLPKAD